MHYLTAENIENNIQLAIVQCVVLGPEHGRDNNQLEAADAANAAAAMTMQQRIERPLLSPQVFS